MSGSQHTGWWWGEAHVELGATHLWQIGPLRLWLERRSGDWRIGCTTDGDPLAQAVRGPDSAPSSSLAEADTVERVAVAGSSPVVRFWPRSADRAVVSRPEAPFRIPAGERVTLFVGSPLWLELSSQKPKRPLVDVPLLRPSDTWFGPATTEGELCYASRTYCLLDLEDLPVRPHRATTAVTIDNRADDVLVLERLKLPVPALGLYVALDGRVWTQDLTLVRREGSGFAAASVRAHAPAHANRPQSLGPARHPHADNAMLRAFSSFFPFGGRGES